MKKYNANYFKKGWFIGNFEPSLKLTDSFEIAYKEYDENFTEAPHYHKIAEEYTIVVQGQVNVNGKVFREGEIIYLKPYEVSSFKTLSKAKTVVVKIPSVKDDKYLISNKND